MPLSLPIIGGKKPKHEGTKSQRGEKDFNFNGFSFVTSPALHATRQRGASVVYFVFTCMICQANHVRRKCKNSFPVKNGRTQIDEEFASMAIWIYYSVGYPASIHAARPPRMGLTRIKPLCNMMNAARALVCSFCQVQ